MEKNIVKVLLIEDDAEDFFLLKQFLNKITTVSYSLDWVSSYEEGLPLVLRQEHDVYLVDYRLGTHTGFDILDVAKEADTTKPIIMLTGLGDAQLGAQAIRKGAEDYLEKGEITSQLLLRSIQYAIERSAARRREAELIEEQALFRAMKQSEERLRQYQERLELAQKAGNIGAFEWFIKRNIVIWTPELEALYGLPEGGFEGKYETWMRYIHPEDLSAVESTFASVLKSGASYSSEYRIVLPDNTHRWMLGRGEVYYDGTDSVHRIVGINMDITERKRLERQKDDFVSIATHELKTPVTSIKAYTQMMHHQFLKKNDTRSAGYLEKMNVQLDKLTSLIADLLDITKIEGGKLPLSKDYFDVNALVEEIVESLQRTTEKHILSLDLGPSVRMWGDCDRIGQVLTNLISNAIKYSPNSRRVDIRTEVRATSIVFYVQDYGIGIPEDTQDKIFEKFFRVTGEKRETFPGLGLGLYISSEIVARHNGKIWFESEEGKGTLFCFSLPIDAPGDGNTL